jgi:FkbM family methyltransferase
MQLHDPADDRYITRSLLATGAFEPFETEILLNELRPGDSVIDVGANVGYYTLLFARRVGDHGRVFAFEPDPANFELLRRNVEANGYENVVLVPLAVTDRCTRARLYLSDSNKGDHRIYDPADGRPFVEVETVTLDQYFEGYDGSIDLIKMDIQGAEFAAAQGMRALLDRQSQVRVATEYWPYALRAAGCDAARYPALLEELGFRLYDISERNRALVRTQASRILAGFPRHPDAFTNLLCVKNADAPDRGTAWCDAKQRRRWQQAGDLRSFERRLGSSEGEEDILEEIFRRITSTQRVCVAIQSGHSDRTRSARLIREHGWQALLVGTDAVAFGQLSNHFGDRQEVVVVREQVGSSNVECLLKDHHLAEEFDLLSVDHDGHDYWIWSGVRRWRPRVVAVAYDASYPPPRRHVAEEDGGALLRQGKEPSGCSIASLAELGREKGYTLVGTDSSGRSAFFVRSDLAANRFLDAEIHYHYSPSRHGRRVAGRPEQI